MSGGGGLSSSLILIVTQLRSVYARTLSCVLSPLFSLSLSLLGYGRVYAIDMNRKAEDDGQGDLLLRWLIMSLLFFLSKLSLSVVLKIAPRQAFPLSPIFTWAGSLLLAHSLRRPTHEVVILSIISTRPRCTAGWLASDASAAFTAHPFTQAPAAAPPSENGERQRQKHLKQPWWMCTKRIDRRHSSRHLTKERRRRRRRWQRRKLLKSSFPCLTLLLQLLFSYSNRTWTRVIILQKPHPLTLERLHY